MNMIAVENLSKKYLISRQENGKLIKEDFWALKDINFEIRQGERVGIIGRNGAGKSTLLKVLSRITEPSQGRVKIKGRVASLLEVGAGFNPELTGRENIYLNGSLLGMTSLEIGKRFDEIVAFAGIARFLDMPVKYYSSGMYMRLAFSVSAHLEAEVLIVDEVLSVGDAEFQRKCLGRMEKISEQGKTVLMVTHNLNSLSEICNKAITLEAGQIAFKGSSTEAIVRYLSSLNPSQKCYADLSNHPNRVSSMRKILKSILCSCGLNSSSCFFQSDVLNIEISYDAPFIEHLAGIGFGIHTLDGIRVGEFNTYMAFQPPHSMPKTGKATFQFPLYQLTPGDYSISVAIGSHPSVVEDAIDFAISFRVLSADIYKTGYLITREDGVTSFKALAQVSEC